MSEDKLEILGARTHNLQNISLSMPRNSLITITGLSGSGKSSLAFDTIYAEGQRRYLETFSSYIRNFMGNMSKPDVDKISGLSPVISIEQKTTNKNPRSTAVPRYRSSTSVCQSGRGLFREYGGKDGEVHGKTDFGGDGAVL